MNPDLYHTICGEYEDLAATIERISADGRITAPELSELVGEFIDAGVVVAERVKDAGPEKKQLVVDALIRLWDEKLADLDAPGPDFIVDATMRALLPIWGGLTIDALVRVYNRFGWPV